MSRTTFSLLAPILLSCFPVLRSAQVDLPDDQRFRRLLVQQLTRDFRYFSYWHMGRFTGYSPGRKVTLATLRNSREYVVCINELNQSTEGLVQRGPRLWAINRSRWERGQENCSEVISQFRHRMSNLDDFEQRRRLLEKNSASVPELPTPTHREEDPNFLEATFEWELPTLELPMPYLHKTKPETIEEVSQEVRRIAAKHRGPECGPGEALIPYFADDDPDLLVWVRLGERCSDGVVHIMAGPEGRLNLGKLRLGEFDNDAVRRLIEPILLERLVLD